MTILVTGATGHFGYKTIEFLLKKGVPAGNIFALVRNPIMSGKLKRKGVNIRVGDYDDYSSLVAAFRDIDKLMMVSGNNINKREQQHFNIIHAAKEAGIKQVVYTSFERKNETEHTPLGIVMLAHIRTEKMLRESRLDYTIMRNNLYMDVLPSFMGEDILDTGIVYPADGGRMACVLRSEMAEAAAVILLGTGHEGREYNISNTENFSFDDIAGILSRLAERPVMYTSPSPETFSDALIKSGIPAEGAQIAVGFANAIRFNEFYTIRSDMEWLLGRKPADPKEFLKRFVHRKIYEPVG